MEVEVNAKLPPVLAKHKNMTSWMILSRMHQLALEINHGVSFYNAPLLKLMKLEGWYDGPVLRGTKKNKQAMLQALIDVYLEIFPGYLPNSSILQALEA